ncbi:TPA: histidine phosphatase family protein [Streptococcus suis]
MKIILLRHLDTSYSIEHRICGQIDCSILPGRELVIPDEITEILHTEIVNIYTSPLKRCLETTELLRNKTNCFDTIIVPEFSERDWGPLAGMMKTQVLQQYGMSISLLRNRLRGIETDYDFSTRVHRGISLFEHCDVSTILIVTHQGCLRIICEFLGIGYSKFKPGEFLLIEKDVKL